MGCTHASKNKKNLEEHDDIVQVLWGRLNLIATLCKSAKDVDIKQNDTIKTFGLGKLYPGKYNQSVYKI